jgi:hypothetical protein
MEQQVIMKKQAKRGQLKSRQLLNNGTATTTIGALARRSVTGRLWRTSSAQVAVLRAR